MGKFDFFVCLEYSAGMSNEIQKEGGLTPHRDELVEFGLIQEIKEIRERTNIADVLSALSDTIRTGGKISRADILTTLNGIVEKISSGDFSPKDINLQEKLSDSDD